MRAFGAPAYEPLDTAVAEVVEDLEEVRWLAACARERLAAARRDATARGNAFRRRTLTTYVAQARSGEAALASIEADAADAARGACGRRGRSRDRLAAERAALADLVRMQIAVSAALVAAADWQSPAFAATHTPGAGRWDGAISEHENDYKRDRHDDARFLEEEFAAEFGGAPEVRSLLTSCGMSAFTTILAYLESTARGAGRVVIGSGLYHECRALLRASSIEHRIVEVDENDTAALVGALEDGGMLFLDALCNARSVAICDLRHILEHAAAHDMSVVVDTTCLSASCRPFLLLPAGARCRLIVFESLTKYAQFGLDRVTAGLILATRPDAEALDVVREHLGTNITDVSACTLPSPNRRRLLRRLKRMERNARIVVRHINDAVGSPRDRVAGAMHPTLPSHPSCRVARSLPFAGALITLSFAGRFRGDDFRAVMVERMLEAGRASGSSLCAGASFGLDVTRIYRTTTGSEADAFVRIAPGIEDVVVIDGLGRALASACTGR